MYKTESMIKRSLKLLISLSNLQLHRLVSNRNAVVFDIYSVIDRQGWEKGHFKSTFANVSDAMFDISANGFDGDRNGSFAGSRCVNDKAVVLSWKGAS